MYSRIILPASILAGTIIGAGMFSLPFVFKEAGLSTGLFYLLFFSSVYIFIYFLYTDLILRTEGEHRFVGYAKKYLGNAGFWISLLIGLIQSFFVLTIYLILAPSFSKLFVGDNYLHQLLAFWLFGSLIILFNTRRIALLEFLIVAGIVFIIAIIFGFSLTDFSSPVFNYWGKLDLSKLLVAGPILFALSGSLAVPELISYFRESAAPINFIKKSLIAGAVLPAAAYLVFVFGILGLSVTVSEDAVSGLVGQVPDVVLRLLGILGFLSLISSYIVVGLNARRILEYDLFLSGWLSRILITIIPISLYMSGFQNFIEAVTFVGSIFLPLESIFIIFMWLKADKMASMPRVLVGNITRASIPTLLMIFFIAIIYFII
ncbi:MAG: hypothetical protein HZB99_04140 [Candidatus Harrisonbacteria bacterium]|nr:hypothetical protein [Candidatus Harrisonbacteria bacterium]